MLLDTSPGSQNLSRLVCKYIQSIGHILTSLLGTSHTNRSRRVLAKRDIGFQQRPPPPDYLWGGIFDDFPAYGWLANSSGVEYIFSAKVLPRSYFVPHQPRSYFSSHRQRYQQHRQYATQAQSTARCVNFLFSPQACLNVLTVWGLSRHHRDPNPSSARKDLPGNMYLTI